MALKPAALRRFTAIHMDVRVFVFVFVISLLTGLLFGLLPAWSASPWRCRGSLAGERTHQCDGHLAQAVA